MNPETNTEVQGLSLFLDEDPNPILRISREGTLLYANRGSWLLLIHWKTQVGMAVPEEWIQIVGSALDNSEEREVELKIGYKSILLVVVPINEKGYVNLYGADVTRRRHIEDKLRLDAQVFENSAEGIMIMDGDLRVLDVNRAFTTITGYAREEILGEAASELLDGPNDPGATREMWSAVRARGSWRGERWGRKKGGGVYPQWVSLSAGTDENGEVTRFVVLFSDITALKKTEEQLYHMAHYDALTGLANRRHFRDLLARAFTRARRTATTLAVLFIDLDSFKLVNDDFGHPAGDRLLQEIAGRINACVRESDVVARMGGDEFTVILSDITAVEDAALVARKILGRISEPVTIEGSEVFVTSSIGISVSGEDSADPSRLLQSADIAMYRAKEQGKNAFQFFSREMNSRADEQLVLQAKIRRALDQGEFTVYYQPQVDLATCRVVGLEALIRWKSPDRGLILPGQFVPMAERSGQICEISEGVLRAVCRQGRLWSDQGLSPVRLAVNISAAHLRRAEFIPLVEAVLAESRIDPGVLEFEITERTLVDDNPETLVKLERLKAMGVSLAIDDFGTKYSALAYLKRLPIDRIKIDSSFICDVAGNSRSREVAAAIVAMGRSLQLDVIAEGVETDEQVHLLRRMSCAYVQGYRFGTPLPHDAVSQILQKGVVAVQVPAA